MSRFLLCATLAASLGGPLLNNAVAWDPNRPATIRRTRAAWILENEILRVGISVADGGVEMTSFFSKEAQREYLTGDAPKQLFSYVYGSSTLAANDGGWTLGRPTTRRIRGFSRRWGKELEIRLSRAAPEAVTVRMIFQIYDGRAGLRYQTFIRNDSDETKTISSSDVISLSFPNDPHVLHGCPIVKWHSRTGAQSPNQALNSVCVYESGDGWAVQPEMNWKTAKLRPEMGSTTGQRTPFAHINAWSNIAGVKVATNPESLQLVLFPHEEFEYIAVNLTAFRGDVIDGRMAMEEHFRKRFKYHNVSSTFFTNDWDWIRKRSEAYYRATVIPAAQRAGLDMIMVDDLWNTTRDSVDPVATFTTDLAALTDFIVSQGLRFGLWFSMTGGGHNQGRDLADPAQIEVKRQQVEDVLIPKYHVSHQMIDLTEFWPNNEVTTYSHPSDNVYRKNVRVRNFLNDVVKRHPEFVGKLTNEVDIAPTRGDRTNGLLHIPDNGFIVTNGGQSEYSPGAGAPMKIAFHSFGYMPMNSIYYGGSPSGKMGQYYGLMLARFIKFNSDPGNWNEAGIALLNRFNTWRKSRRIRAMTEEIIRPLYAGPTFDPQMGPYAWMYVTPRKTRALLIATAAERPAPDSFVVPVRWLDPEKTYLVADITMNSEGHDYAFKGRFTGAELRTSGLTVDFTAQPSKGRAYWLQEDRGRARQVLYANEAITRYTEASWRGRLTVWVQGVPNGEGVLIVFDRASQTASTVTVPIGARGWGRITLP